jgi:hypothetical protein
MRNILTITRITLEFLASQDCYEFLVYLALGLYLILHGI